MVLVGICANCTRPSSSSLEPSCGPKLLEKTVVGARGDVAGMAGLGRGAAACGRGGRGRLG